MTSDNVSFKRNLVFLAVPVQVSCVCVCVCVREAESNLLFRTALKLPETRRKPIAISLLPLRGSGHQPIALSLQPLRDPTVTVLVCGVLNLWTPGGMADVKFVQWITKSCLPYRNISCPRLITFCFDDIAYSKPE